MAANCAAVQTPRPAPSDGLIVTPSASLMMACLTWVPARRCGSSRPLALPSRLKSNPVEDVVRPVERRATGFGSNCSVSQPSSGAGSPPPSLVETVASAPSPSHEVARRVKLNGPEQEAGRDRYGRGGETKGSPAVQVPG